MEFYPFDEIRDFDLDDFLVSCSSASDVIPSMGGIIIIRPQNFSEYLINKKNQVLMDFIKFCELGEFLFMQIVNEWFGKSVPR